LDTQNNKKLNKKHFSIVKKNANNYAKMQITKFMLKLKLMVS